VAAGRRSRKTLIGLRKVLDAALRNAGHRYFCAAPTWSQAQNIFWQRLEYDTRRLRPKDGTKGLTIRLLNGSEICLFGLDKPERIEGQIWHGGLITEYPNVRPDAWNAHIRPVLSDTNGWCIREGVPEGRNFYYEECLYAAGGSIPITKPFEGAYAENPDDPDVCYYSWFSSDVLPASEIESARRHMPSRLFRQEYEASFEGNEGVAYYGFDNSRNVDDNACQYIKDAPIYVGMDFNVHPMSAVLAHRTDDGFHIFREIFLPNSNTKEMVQHICAAYPQCGAFNVTPCQSSSARQTSQDIGVTDLRIVRTEFAAHKREVHVYKRTRNPPVVDRINCTNSLLEHKRLLIHSSCVELKKDWGSLTYKPGTRDLDLKDKMRGHISAACDYLCEYWFPIRFEDVGETSLNLTL